MSNLQARLLTAAFLIIIVLVATVLGGLIFRVLCLLIGTAICYEWQNLTKAHQTPLSRAALWLGCMLIGVLLLLEYQLNEVTPIIILAAMAGGAIILFILGAIPRRSLKDASWQAFGLLYALSAPITLSFMRDKSGHGLAAVIFLYVVVWSTDSAAYFVGRLLGGPKLIPTLSPNKTWSGALGGALVSILAAISVALISEFSLSIFAITVLACALSIISQIGDIMESWMKRHFKVKDSGTILPGHGGFMDRVDGLITAALLFYLLDDVFALI